MNDITQYLEEPSKRTMRQLFISPACEHLFTQALDSVDDLGDITPKELYSSVGISLADFINSDYMLVTPWFMQQEYHQVIPFLIHDPETKKVKITVTAVLQRIDKKKRIFALFSELEKPLSDDYFVQRLISETQTDVRLADKAKR